MGRFLCGRPSSATTPTHLHSRASLPAHYRTTVTDRRDPHVRAVFPQSPLLRARVSSPAKFPSTGQPPITTPRHKDGRVFTYNLESSRQLRCAMASHHRCPTASALVAAASIEFRSRPLSDEVLEQAAPLAKLPLPNACHGGHRLALHARARSHIVRVRCRPSLRHVNT
jgi:hypothetical protein